MGRGVRQWLRILACGASLLVGGALAQADVLDAHIDAAAKLLDVRAQATLKQIPDPHRQLLAMRGYLRSGKQFGDRWSWSQSQIERYNRSKERKAANAELERISERFAEQNPGYTLRVNTQVRSLDSQIANWNANPSVAKTATRLHAAVEKELKRGIYPKEPTLGSTAQFAAFLNAWVPQTPAPLAVPGLSRHGQARAFDFQIMRGDQVVASTNINFVKPVWDRQGWTDKLKDAITSSSDRFVGPLPAPYEPWHYEYTGHAARLAEADAPPPRSTHASPRESGS